MPVVKLFGVRLKRLQLSLQPSTVSASGLLLLVLAVFNSAPLVAADLILKTDQFVTGPNSHVRLTNTGTQPVTAWALVTILPTGNGQTRREVWTVDGYMSEVTHGLAGSLSHLERLMPGEMREIPLDALPADATIEVAAVVLDDGTADGDEDIIASLFDRRLKERDALDRVARTFEEVLSRERGASVLALLRARLTALVQADPSVPGRAALNAVETYQRNASSDLDGSLRTYAAFVVRQHEVAVKHATRKSR